MRNTVREVSAVRVRISLVYNCRITRSKEPPEGCKLEKTGVDDPTYKLNFYDSERYPFIQTTGGGWFRGSVVYSGSQGETRIAADNK